MKPVRVPDLRAMKVQGTKITVLTAYDAGMAKLLDRAGLDIILVGDSVGMVVLGYDTTLPVSIGEIKSVGNGSGASISYNTLICWRAPVGR